MPFAVTLWLDCEWSTARIPDQEFGEATVPDLDKLQNLCGSFDQRAMSREEFVSRCTRLIADLIGCSRAGIWLFEQARVGQTLRCLGIFDGAKSRMTLAPDESSLNAGLYLQVLEQTGHVVAPDARTHPATASLFLDSLAINGVQSLLATSFSVNGHLYGAFTCTEVGRFHHWTPAQLVLLKRVAARASLSLAGASQVGLPTLPAPL